MINWIDLNFIFMQISFVCFWNFMNNLIFKEIPHNENWIWKNGVKIIIHEKMCRKRGEN